MLALPDPVGLVRRHYWPTLSKLVGYHLLTVQDQFPACLDLATLTRAPMVHPFQLRLPANVTNSTVKVFRRFERNEQRKTV